ncbi:MAG: DUF5606 domain-containing protein [Parafilimonas sp.]|nr:DUF5606 domain-containing protein [Parafilimonas sp.]
MEYSKLISVTGLPGLFELIASKADGAIVRSLEDKTTRFVSSRIHNFSHLESIEVYTEEDNVNLVDVFYAMQNSNEALPGEKDANAVRGYFTKVYPKMDFERVYASDMKKMVKWFDILKKNDIEIKLSEETADENDETPHQETQTAEPELKEPETKSEIKTKESKKAKASKTKTEEAGSVEETSTISEPKAAKKKSAKKSFE